MFKKIKAFFDYLFTKSSELKDLDAKDALLAKVVLDIHRKRTHSVQAIVPLFSLMQIHAIDRENAINSTEERVSKLQQVKDSLLSEQTITRKVLDVHLPSVSGIKVVRASDDRYIAYEGNGRLVALQQVFTPADGIDIEVEEYLFRNPKKILRRMQRVRKMNGFVD